MYSELFAGNERSSSELESDNSSESNNHQMKRSKKSSEHEDCVIGENDLSDSSMGTDLDDCDFMSTSDEEDEVDDEQLQNDDSYPEWTDPRKNNVDLESLAKWIMFKPSNISVL